MRLSWENGAGLGRMALRAGERILVVFAVGLATAFFTLFALDLARGASTGDALGHASREFSAYVARLSDGDLGTTSVGGPTSRRLPVAQVLAVTLPRSLGLLGVTLGVATLVGVLLGAAAAVSRRRLASSFLLFCSIVGASAPSFFVALLLQIVVLKATQFAGRNVLPVGGFGWGGELVLPTLVLAARPVSQIARITFIKVREILEQDYIRTAHGKGVAFRRILSRHVARNAVMPVLTTAAVSLRFALASLPVVEVYFGWSGAGYTLLRAISNRDDNLTVALLLSLALVFLAVQMLLEISYPLLDPRLGKAALELEEPRASFRDTIAAIVDGARSVVRAPREWLAYLLRAAAKRARRPRARVPRETSARKPGSPRYRVNIPLLAGGLLCVGVLVVVFFGADLAPHNPYLTRGLEKVGGTYMGPPFAPSAKFPWGTDVLGRDLLSLVLAGAQQTLLLAAVAVAARMAIGVLLGAMAGWRRGSLLDRAIVGLSQIITPFPALLLAMLIILAVGIRQGVVPFAIGLCVIGWGELAQFVRAEMIALKSRPFVESARAVGMRTPRLVAAHLLPHMAPSLVALLAVEFSAVLVVLGELGFLGIFLGGGAYAEMEMFSPPFHYSDVPEWGALLATFRQSARAHPWLGIYPSLAIFISSFGFYLVGEGIRREIERGSFSLRRVVNRYTFGAAVAVGVVFYAISGSLGPAGVYRRDAGLFDGERAAAHVEALTEGLGGRELGSVGAIAAADYVAAEFGRLSLQAIGEGGGYFVSSVGGFERLTEPPALSLDDGGTALRYGVDFAEYADRFRCVGDAEGEVRFVSFGDRPTYGELDVSRFKRVDLSREVILVLSPADAELLAGRPCAGVLVVADGEDALAERAVLSPESRADWAFTGGTVSSTPIDRVTFWISESTADRILSGSGWTTASLRARVPEVDARNPLTFVLPRRASVCARGELHDDVSVRHVIGWIPGTRGAQRDQLDNQVVAVLAQYDTWPARPGPAQSEGANDNASGVAVLLEIARLLTQSEYAPGRSFLLVAFSGVGWDGGEFRGEPSAEVLLKQSIFPPGRYTVEAVVRLQAVGRGATSRLAVETSGGMRLSNVFRSAASRMGARMVVSETAVDLRSALSGKTAFEAGERSPEATLSYDRWREATAPNDLASAVAASALERAGRAAALGLMIMGSERDY
ncbi:MAG: ABC transporter permease subunit [Candidatus Bipolaricaulis sp.]|nr:ABC transporter permease subunit [Candidatus Bipolaricaulis sp.]